MVSHQELILCIASSDKIMAWEILTQEKNMYIKDNTMNLVAMKEDEIFVYPFRFLCGI